jgi:hypothetical protein
MIKGKFWKMAFFAFLFQNIILCSYSLPPAQDIYYVQITMLHPSMDVLLRMPEPQYQPFPDYPCDEKIKNKSGFVLFSVVIRADGKVQDCYPIVAAEPFWKSVKETAMQWTYSIKPDKVGSTDDKIKINYIIHFITAKSKETLRRQKQERKISGA